MIEFTGLIKVQGRMIKVVCAKICGLFNIFSGFEYIRSAQMDKDI